MMPKLTTNTQAILLLTAPLLLGRAPVAADLLTPGEYKRLARWLHQSGHEPSDLLGPDASMLIGQLSEVASPERLNLLLARGLSLSQAIDRWHSRSIWVCSRADAHYPQALRHRLKEDRPAVIYGCGDPHLLDRGGLAVVGSRNADESLLQFTQEVSNLAAASGISLISGGARGVDMVAMQTALQVGGSCMGVLADSLEKHSLQRDNRDALMEGRLVLVSSYDPLAGFNVGHAMQRNKIIYALADAGLVVNADLGKGGTWTGALEQLDKYKRIPLYVRSSGSSNPALTALIEKGAMAWPNPTDRDALRGALTAHLQQPVDQAELVKTAALIAEAVTPVYPVKVRKPRSKTRKEPADLNGDLFADTQLGD
jgi:DNA processing protein